jgi:NTE family protein
MFKAIALGGGGARGGLHVGALAAVEERIGNLTFPDGIYGCSIGAVIGTAIAFKMNAKQIQTMTENDFNLGELLPSIRLKYLTEFSKTKGLFPIEYLEKMIVNGFKKQGIDLVGKNISDSPQKLYIAAYNLTMQKTTLFTGNVPLLPALLASCCLPFVFTPQVIYDNLYLDGGLNIDCISEIVPKDCLVIHIGSPPSPVFPADLETLSIGSMVSHIYRSIRKTPVSSNVMWLKDYETGTLDDLNLEKKKRIIEGGYSQARRFLAKRFPQETK